MHEAAALPFHLLRPQWLIALVPVVAILALVLWRQRAETQWGGLVASHLLKHLIVRPDEKWGINPAWLVASGISPVCASRRAAAMSSAVRVAVPLGASTFSGWCISMTSADG